MESLRALYRIGDYRETANGGLAKRWNHFREKKRKDGGMLQDGQYSLR
jgi:hypothetical protein